MIRFYLKNKTKKPSKFSVLPHLPERGKSSPYVIQYLLWIISTACIFNMFHLTITFVTLDP